MMAPDPLNALDSPNSRDSPKPLQTLHPGLRFAHGDEVIASALADSESTRPATIKPGEGLAIRCLLALAAPAWAFVTLGVSVARLARGRLPLVVLHERVGWRRERLVVPKIATAKVGGNRRCFGGLVEVATGPPAELSVDGRLEQWLRSTGLDELPQLMLIVIGKMRLVGPRPVTSSELEEMIAVRDEVGVDQLHPGLLGLWQVLDRHAYLLPARRDLDMLMIDNWSPRLRRRIVTLAIRQALARARTRQGDEEIAGVSAKPGRYHRWRKVA